MSASIGDVVFVNIAGYRADIIIYIIKKKIGSSKVVVDYIRRNRSLFPVDVPYLQLIRDKKVPLTEVEHASKLRRHEFTQFKCETISDLFNSNINLKIKIK